MRSTLLTATVLLTLPAILQAADARRFSDAREPDARLHDFYALLVDKPELARGVEMTGTPESRPG